MLKVKNMDIKKVVLLTLVNFSSTQDGLSINRSLFFMYYFYLFITLFIIVIVFVLVVVAVLNIF